ncbi:unnamed protein product [Didymodactylos carnosus]|uniref:Palmitoyltransferase n=1 Tax=Didymodactylos carnosus TaxID=1234261 RepID=A0A813XKH2_9BILA|nr:unnamed protein product [Didymodactylos carnosus]CAF1004452.1 unnamed protein product [Didymodactylos carnosus]CAF3664209.1 unnamed protein product [Didymodactylos carnosus]CAF3773779.1 unnamed protein product [Didymodactylos carnosus]
MTCPSVDSVDLKIDTLLQPIFSITNRIAKYLGRLFIVFFLCIIAVVLYVFYFCIFCHLYFDKDQHTFFMFLLHFIFGHWLLINILFNYIQAVRTDPGSSPNFGKSKPYNFAIANNDCYNTQENPSNSDTNNNISNATTIVQLSEERKSNKKYSSGKYESNYKQLKDNDEGDTVQSLLTSTSKLPDSLEVYNQQSQMQNQKLHCHHVCRKCIFPKPARAHHCSVCNRCILNQDHHCPWVNNCIGHLNHRYFFQFCFFLTLGSFYAATLGFSEYQHFMFGEKRFSYLDLILGTRITDNDILPSVTNPSMHFTMLYLFIVCVSACFVLFFFTLWHFWLVSRAETTIEYHINSTERARLKLLKLKFQNPYSLGFKTNWQLFLGFHSFYDILYKNLLPSAHRPFSDGIHWPMRTYTNVNTPLLNV